MSADITQPGGAMPQGEQNTPSEPKPTDYQDKGQLFGSLNPQFLTAVKGFFNKLSGASKTVSGGAKSAFNASSQTISSATTDGSSLAARLKKVGVMFVALLVVVGVVYAAVSLFSTVKDEIASNGNGSTSDVTPTVFETTPSEPSIYAEDEIILQLEEDINTLDAEMTNTALRETSLNLPTLDFNIKF